MCQTDHQIILKKTLNDDISVNSAKIEVDGKHIEHIQTFLFHEILQDGIELALRDVFDTTVFDKFL